MILRMVRDTFTPQSVIGQITIDRLHECFTLEHPAYIIPAGRYEVTLYLSPRFHRVLPLLNGVPDRTDIEIHVGNWARDSHGCILAGWVKGRDYIGASTRAVEALVNHLTAIPLDEKIFIEISEAQKEQI